MSTARYNYKYRPYYFNPKVGMRGKMIEFFKGSGEKEFVNWVAECIKELYPELGKAEDMWPITETRIPMKTSLGSVSFTIDEWDNVFLEGKNLILDRIDGILNQHPDWEKLEVFERDYHLKRK